MQSVLRYLMMLRHVPRQPHKIDAKTLQQRLYEQGVDVSVRTIQRNLIELSEVFPLTADERSKPYGWSIAQSAPQLPFLNLADHARPSAVAQVKLKCAASLSNLLTNNPLHPQQVVEMNSEHFIVTATVAISNELVAWILSCGEHAEVLEPKQLRDEIEGHIRRMHASYNGHKK
ncbi:WYL domain-containing protein [Pseudidiomarina donghaiensis]|uniref:WYL domain-containing protein n=1 Tax=Pseudidiomarina donghaiensis TaxID=519452 RepID=UPI0008F1BBA5|nr:WYL domain-containing protein [Pseudidiomarina donghaiensis]SFV23926.1 WYL domain-containing protein [Pseudidiomarina donghaiensis]